MAAHALDREMGLARIGRAKHRNKRFGIGTRHVEPQDGGSAGKSKHRVTTRLTAKTIHLIAAIACKHRD
jgi:hypothetical protein